MELAAIEFELIIDLHWLSALYRVAFSSSAGL